MIPRIIIPVPTNNKTADPTKPLFSTDAAPKMIKTSPIPNQIQFIMCLLLYACGCDPSRPRSRRSTPTFSMDLIIATGLIIPTCKETINFFHLLARSVFQCVNTNTLFLRCQQSFCARPVEQRGPARAKACLKNSSASSIARRVSRFGTFSSSIPSCSLAISSRSLFVNTLGS